MPDMRERIKEIAEIAASVPENLQQSCFELLLKHYLASEAQSASPGNADAPVPQAESPAPAPEPAASVDHVPGGQGDLTQADLHVKVRRFMERYAITLEHLNNLFYKQDDAIMPLYEDLKTTRMAEAQVRVALLLALKNAFATGDFEAAVDTVRTECRDRKCYDQANFAANFQRNQSLFDGSYTKQTASLRLSEPGRQELAQLLQELQ